MKKIGLIMLILALFLVSMPVLAVDLELTNSFSQEIQETTTIIIKEELAINNYDMVQNIECEIRLYAPPSNVIVSPAHPWEPLKQTITMTGYGLIESDDPNEYKYQPTNRYFDHPAFLGVA